MSAGGDGARFPGTDDHGLEFPLTSVVGARVGRVDDCIDWPDHVE